MRTSSALAALLAVCAISGIASPGEESPVAGAKQIIVVISPGWDSPTAVMRRYDRTTTGWREAGPVVNVVIGRTGLAWGSGVNRETGSGPVKREGDGKSPAGVFHLGTAFGFGSTPDFLKLPYLQLHETTECVDDTGSEFYNRVVDRTGVAHAGWTSSEKMRSIDVYRWGVVVLHNDPPRKSGGSCIFLHLVDPKGKPTAGCTSMPAAAIEALLRWVDPASTPLLVQLPRAEYDRLRGVWQLP